MTTLLVMFLAGLAFCLSRPAGRRNVAANIAEGTHSGILTKRDTVAVSTRYLLRKFGATADLVAVCGASDLPLGPSPDESDAASDPIAVELLGVNPSTSKMVASEAIAVGDEVYTAAAGKVQDLPVAGGTYYKVGIALTPAAADGDVLEVSPCSPLETTVS